MESSGTLLSCQDCVSPNRRADASPPRGKERTARRDWYVQSEFAPDWEFCRIFFEECLKVTADASAPRLCWSKQCRTPWLAGILRPRSLSPRSRSEASVELHSSMLASTRCGLPCPSIAD